MKSTSILRDLKLDIVMGNETPIIDKFNEITKDLKVIKTDVYEKHGQEYILYNKNNEWIFYQDVKNEDFWCNYKLYWSFFKEEFGLKYKEIQEITKYMVEDTLKIKVDTPTFLAKLSSTLVEETLKIKVTTPSFLQNKSVVEETLKNEKNEKVKS